MPAEPTRVALIQMACVPSVAANLDHASDLVREAARVGRPAHLPARALPRTVLLPARGPRPLRPRRTHPGPLHRAPRRHRPRGRHHPHRQPLRAPRPRPLPQHRRRAGPRSHRTRPDRRHLPQDAHPRRPTLLREVLLCSRRSGLSRFRRPATAQSAPSSAGTSGTPRPPASPR